MTAPVPAWARQSDAEVRFDWGADGASALADTARFVVVVDVLRFTTAVDAAVAQRARVYPHRWKDDSAVAFAASVGAQLAAGDDPTGPSLSPVRLSRLAAGDRVVLPSPNGSTCAAVAADAGATVVAACLRNASAVASWLNAVMAEGDSVAVIACGERWPNGSLRPAVEDLLGAAAVLAQLRGTPSAEARAALATWSALRDDVDAVVRSSASGRELVTRGWADDLAFALEVDASAHVPVLRDGAFVGAAR